MMKPISRLPPLPDKIYADPGRHDWYFRERKQDSVASYIRDDLHREAIAALEAKVAAADALAELLPDVIRDAFANNSLAYSEFTTGDVSDATFAIGWAKIEAVDAALAAYRGAGK